MFALTVCFVGVLSAAALPLNSPILQSYDYIVIGGGPAGLTVANRLSEDPTVDVLLLEAGPADEREPYVEIAGLIGLNIGSRYDWNLSTLPQVHLDGATRHIPQGHALGGGTVLNGMLWSRGGRGDYDDWVSLGNEGWSWDDLLPYFKKSETYTPLQSMDMALQFSVEEDPYAHGYSGPVNVSFPRYLWNSSALLFDALNELGVPTSFDPNNGQIAGASFLPLDLNPESQTRCTARNAYYDPIRDRPNLWVSTGQYVTQILFSNGLSNSVATAPDTSSPFLGQGGSPGVPGGIFGDTTTLNPAGSVHGNVRRSIKRVWKYVSGLQWRREIPPPVSRVLPANLRATGVEFSPNTESARRNILATREVIVAAGAIHSPQLLMLSGIGPATQLQQLQIPVKIDIPGVGSNLQDHGQTWAFYPYSNRTYDNPTMLEDNITFATSAWSDYWAERTGPLTTSAIDGVAFPALPFIVNGSQTIANLARAQSPSQFLPAQQDTAVMAGYAAQFSLLTAALTDVRRASYEIINANNGVLTVATMRPFSRGTVTINSFDPFDPPLIDPRYGSNPVDLQVIMAALRFNERLLTTESLSTMAPDFSRTSPSTGSSDAELLHYIQSQMQTEYHPGGTCAMMPLELGGVVDSNLLVYGTQNLRIVDSSILPMLPAAHLQALIYAVGEKAADIIKAAAGATGGGQTDPVDLPHDTITPLPPLLPTSTTMITIVQTQTVYV